MVRKKLKAKKWRFNVNIVKEPAGENLEQGDDENGDLAEEKCGDNDY